MTRCTCRPGDPCENCFLAQVRELATLQGWRVYHTLHSLGSDPGFPDLILTRGWEMLALELKRNGKKATRAQDAWLDAFHEVETVDAYCWTPSLWPLIEAALKREA